MKVGLSGIGYIQAEYRVPAVALGREQHGAPGVRLAVYGRVVDVDVGQRRRGIDKRLVIGFQKVVLQARQEVGRNKGPQLLARSVVGTLIGVTGAVIRRGTRLVFPFEIAPVFLNSGGVRVVTVTVFPGIEGVEHAVA